VLVAFGRLIGGQYLGVAVRGGGGGSIVGIFLRFMLRLTTVQLESYSVMRCGSGDMMIKMRVMKNDT
jgi:hypothetical protein